MLEPGEFVMRKAVVDRFGPTFFANMNGMKKGGRVGKNTAATMAAIAAATKMPPGSSGRSAERLPWPNSGNVTMRSRPPTSRPVLAGQVALAQLGRGITAAAQGLTGRAGSGRACAAPAAGDPLMAVLEEKTACSGDRTT